MTTTNATYQPNMTDESVPNFHDMKVTFTKQGTEFVPDDWEEYASETDEPVQDIQSEPEDAYEPVRSSIFPPQIIELLPGGRPPRNIQLLPAKRPTDTPIFVPNWSKNSLTSDAVGMDFSKQSYNGPVQEFEPTPQKVLNPSKNLNKFCPDRLSLKYAEELEQFLNIQNTRPCAYKLNGNCKDGRKCAFAHDKTELMFISCEHGSECYSKEKCKFWHPHETLDDTWTRLCKISQEFFDKAKAEKDSSKAVDTKPQKTRPCLHFINEQCDKGDKCTFAHSPRDLKLTRCRYGIECHNKNDKCEYYHQQCEHPWTAWRRLCQLEKTKVSSKAVCEVVTKPQKTRPCLHFINGRCDKGDKCSFAHGPRDLKLTTCRYGDECRKKNDKCEYYHSQSEHPDDVWTRLCQLEKTKDKSRQKQDTPQQKQDKPRQKQVKTRPCYQHLVDHCRDGDKCTFAHSAEEFNPITCFRGSKCHKKKTCPFSHPSETRQKVWKRSCAIAKAQKNV